MIIVLNGPLGIGKSTLAEALTESIDGCAMLSGDHLVAVNPPSKTELEHLHSAIELLILHHRRFGYRNFVIEHVWRTESELTDLTDLKRRLDDPEVHCFLLTLPIEENLRRVERRQEARAIDEREFEHATIDVRDRRSNAHPISSTSGTAAAAAASCESQSARLAKTSRQSSWKHPDHVGCCDREWYGYKMRRRGL